MSDLLGRNFTTQAPNSRYIGDIASLPVGEGRSLYRATPIDLYSRRPAGWSIADHMRTDLVADALKAAAAAWGGNLRGTIFHGGNGTLFASKRFTEPCDALKVTRSRGAMGTSEDNASAESFNANLERDTLQGAKR